MKPSLGRDSSGNVQARLVVAQERIESAVRWLITQWVTRGYKGRGTIAQCVTRGYNGRGYDRTVQTLATYPTSHLQGEYSRVNCVFEHVSAKQRS